MFRKCYATATRVRAPLPGQWRRARMAPQRNVEELVVALLARAVLKEHGLRVRPEPLGVGRREVLVVLLALVLHLLVEVLERRGLAAEFDVRLPNSRTRR